MTYNSRPLTYPTTTAILRYIPIKQRENFLKRAPDVRKFETKIPYTFELVCISSNKFRTKLEFDSLVWNAVKLDNGGSMVTGPNIRQFKTNLSSFKCSERLLSFYLERSKTVIRKLDLLDCYPAGSYFGGYPTSIDHLHINIINKKPEQGFLDALRNKSTLKIKSVVIFDVKGQFVDSLFDIGFEHLKILTFYAEGSHHRFLGTTSRVVQIKENARRINDDEHTEEEVQQYVDRVIEVIDAFRYSPTLSVGSSFQLMCPLDTMIEMMEDPKLEEKIDKLGGEPCECDIIRFRVKVSDQMDIVGSCWETVRDQSVCGICWTTVDALFPYSYKIELVPTNQHVSCQCD